MLLKANKQYFNCKSRIFPFAFSIYSRKPDGNDIVTFTIVRNSESRGSYKDINLRQKDTIHFRNETTGKTFTLTGCQTVVSNFKDGNPKTPAGNTIRSNEKFSMQYLKSDASKYKGPVFNVQNANTDGLGMIDDNGVDVLDKSDKRPFRLHSNILKNSDKLPMASDGCPMYPGEQIDAFDEFLQESNIKPGDVLQGFIKEDINYGP